jgi:hypothetical protein
MKYFPIVLLLIMLSIPTAVSAQVSSLETAVNQYRVVNGATALHVDTRLEAAAQSKINYMLSSGCYLPRCVNEPVPYDRQQAAGYPSTGNASELIDTDHPTVQGVIDAWTVDSSGNRFILLLGLFTDLGCASGMAGSTPLWVCDFGQQATTPTSTGVPTTSTATSVPATSTSAPTATATTTPGVGEPMGECARVWYSDDGSSSAARFGARSTQFECVGF